MDHGDDQAAGSRPSGLTSEPTATMTWYDQLTASGRLETLKYS